MTYRNEREAALYGCGGPCDQGRKPCCTPEACELPLFADSPRASGAIALALVVACVVVALILANEWRRPVYTKECKLEVGVACVLTERGWYQKKL